MTNQITLTLDLDTGLAADLLGYLYGRKTHVLPAGVVSNPNASAAVVSPLPDVASPVTAEHIQAAAEAAQRVEATTKGKTKRAKPAGDTTAPSTAFAPKNAPDADFEEVRTAAREFSEKFGKANVKVMLNEYGAEKLSDIRPENFKDFIEALKNFGADEDDELLG